MTGAKVGIEIKFSFRVGAGKVAKVVAWDRERA